MTTRLTPKELTELSEYAELFQNLEQIFGFPPNDFLTLAYKPAIMKAVGELTGIVVFAPGITPVALRLLVMYMTARAAASVYCSAHLALLSEKNGVSLEQIGNIREFASHPAFSAVERAALTVAEKAGRIPNAVTDEDHAALKALIGEEGIVEVVSAIGLMSFFNRWNDVNGTPIETDGRSAGERHIPGWVAGRHV